MGDARLAISTSHSKSARDSGVTLEQAQDVLVAVAPIVGTPRTASATGKIAEAPGRALDLAEAAQDG